MAEYEFVGYEQDGPESLDEGLRIEARCFNRLIGDPEMEEGRRRFIERDHPHRKTGESSTPGIRRPRSQ
jgi:enoyl-CoA hydratase